MTLSRRIRAVRAFSVFVALLVTIDACNAILGIDPYDRAPSDGDGDNDVTPCSGPTQNCQDKISQLRDAFGGCLQDQKCESDLYGYWECASNYFETNKLCSACLADFEKTDPAPGERSADRESVTEILSGTCQNQTITCDLYCACMFSICNPRWQEFGWSSSDSDCLDYCMKSAPARDCQTEHCGQAAAAFALGKDVDGTNHCYHAAYQNDLKGQNLCVVLDSGSDAHSMGTPDATDSDTIDAQNDADALETGTND